MPCSLFKVNRKVKLLFGFPLDMDPTSLDIKQSKQFLVHATSFVEMIDTVVNMLGPDMDMLTEALLEIGAKHMRYGVKPEMYADMGNSLIHVLEQLIPDEMGHEDTKQAWLETYQTITHDMIRAYFLEKKKSSRRRMVPRANSGRLHNKTPL